MVFRNRRALAEYAAAYRAAHMERERAPDRRSVRLFSLVAEQHGFCPGRRRKAPWRRALWHHDAMARHGAIAPGRHGGPRRPRAAALGTDVQEWAFNLVAKQHGRLFRSKLELTARWRTTIGQGEPAHTPRALTGGSRNDHVVKSTPLARTGGCRNDHVVKSTSLT